MGDQVAMGVPGFLTLGAFRIHAILSILLLTLVVSTFGGQAGTRKRTSTPIAIPPNYSGEDTIYGTDFYIGTGRTTPLHCGLNESPLASVRSLPWPMFHHDFTLARTGAQCS